MTTHGRQVRGDQRGVTLVELLVVVAVGALIAVPVAGWVISTLGHQDASQHLLRNAVGTGRLAAAISRDVAGANQVSVNTATDCSGGGGGEGGTVVMNLLPSSAPGQVVYTQAPSRGGSQFQSIWRRECDAAGDLVEATELFERVVTDSADAACLAGESDAAGDCDAEADRRVRFVVTPCPTRPIEAARQCDPALGTTTPIELQARRRVTPGYEQYSGNGPVAQIQVDPRIGYRSTTFNFDASSSRGIDGATVTWTFPDGSTATGATASKQFSSAGEHEVRVTLVSAGLTTSAVATVRVVDRYPVASATATKTDTGFVFDGSGSTHPDGLALETFRWDFGGGDVIFGAQVSRTFAELGSTGRRRAVLEVTDSAGQKDSATVVVDLPGEPPPQAGPITIDPAPQATPGRTALVGTVGPGLPMLTMRFSSDDASTNWTWRLRRTNGQVIATAPAGPYAHDFGEQGHGEFEIARVGPGDVVVGEPVAFRINAAPRAAFDVETAGAGSATRFVGDGPGGSSDPDGPIESWRWSFGTGDIGTGPTPSYVYPAPGTYVVSLTVRDSDGIESTFDRLVRVPGTPAAPPPVTWTGTGVTWAAIPGAEEYRVTMWCTVGAPYIADVPPTTLAVAVPPGYCDGGALWATLQVRANDIWSSPSPRSDR